VTVRFMEWADLNGAAQIHQLIFTRQQHSYEWLHCNFNAAPRCLSFVAIVNDQVVGYIMWMQKSGFRSEVVLELEQMAVKPECQGQGIGRKLIMESLPLVKQQLSKNGSRLKHILVTTRADNFAQKLYKQTLGAEVETTITNLYSADEVLMIARNVSI
jgi:ribosomal protein S18 acetylase RimI-like enzyme